MINYISILLSVLLPWLSISSDIPENPWGFYGHRKINRMAIFTLPPEMLSFYKTHIEYITEHSVDPDKRRYATVYEAVRHYMDLDHWGRFPFENVPRELTDALIRYSDIYIVNGTDTLGMFSIDNRANKDDTIFLETSGCGIKKELLKRVFWEELIPNYPQSPWLIEKPGLEWIGNCSSILPNADLLVIDKFSEHGILPYHLNAMYRQLSNAFYHNDAKRILRLSADMGHYVSDAHVPLHTTKNYNGQLTDQLGIHAFWESRIPELFAETEYDFFVGKPVYIETPVDYFWEIVLDSHMLLDSVLTIEKRLSREFPSDNQYCFEERLDRTARVPCYEYANAYQNAMNGMVEKRMRDAVFNVASVWYSAWVDAGQPDLKLLLNEIQWTKEEMELDRNLDDVRNTARPLGREHNE